MLGAAERGFIHSVSIFLLWLSQVPADESGWAGKEDADHSQVYREIITPQWRVGGSPGRDKHPPKAEIKITAEGRNFILDVEKNESLAMPPPSSSLDLQVALPLE